LKENLVSKIFVCPNPLNWNQVYEDLLKVWESMDRKVSKPPTPLILNAWWACSDLEKHNQWEETVKWAERNDCADLIPEFTQDQRYEVDEMKTHVKPYWNNSEEKDSETG
jgi:hypothetical protein